jgi:LytS/YehU family sensor histidine kinase
VGNSGPDFQSWSAADYRLRQTLQASEREIVNLDEEISFVQDYLETERARFGERLWVEQMV